MSKTPITLQLLIEAQKPRYAAAHIKKLDKVLREFFVLYPALDAQVYFGDIALIITRMQK